MRALTVLQPFATALVREGRKRVENRPRPFPSTVPLPAWVAIHAGARPFPDVWVAEAAMLRLGPEAIDRVLPMRRVVGAVRFVRSVSLADWLERPWRASRCKQDDPWASGPWCWARDLCVEIEDAPEIRGALGLWTLTGPTIGLLREAIASKYGADEAARAVTR